MDQALFNAIADRAARIVADHILARTTIGVTGTVGTALETINVGDLVVAKPALVRLEKKRCSKCGIKQDPENFHKLASSKDGRQAWCKPCLKAYAKKRAKTFSEGVEAIIVAAPSPAIEASAEALDRQIFPTIGVAPTREQNARLDSFLATMTPAAPPAPAEDGWVTLLRPLTEGEPEMITALDVRATLKDRLAQGGTPEQISRYRKAMGALGYEYDERFPRGGAPKRWAFWRLAEV